MAPFWQRGVTMSELVFGRADHTATWELRSSASLRSSLTGADAWAGVRGRSAGCTGSHQRPWPLALGDEGEVEQEGLLMVTAEHLEPHRQPVERARGDRDSRVAVDVGGDGERTLVPERLLEPVVLHQVDVADGRGEGPFCREGHVGVGGRHHEVDLLEEGCHRLVELLTLALDPRRRLEVEHGGSDVQTELDLGGEVVRARGIAVAKQVAHADET